MIGRTTCDAPAYRLSATPITPGRSIPLLGQHNEYVYRDLLGYDEAAFQQLLIDGAIE